MATVNVYICLPNDGEYEFEAEVNFTAGDPGKYDGPPENCYPAEPAEWEFENFGPFACMFDAVLTACYIHSCPMTIQEMEDLAEKVEEETITRELESDGYEPDEPDDFDDIKWPF